MRRLFRLDDTKRQHVTGSLVTALETAPDVVFAHLHGSFVSEPAFHDVDVAVWLAGPADQRTAWVVELADTLSTKTGLPVDVRALNDAALSFRFHALRGLPLVSRDDEVRATVIEDTARGYHDIEPLLRQAARDAGRR